MGDEKVFCLSCEYVRHETRNNWRYVCLKEEHKQCGFLKEYYGMCERINKNNDCKYYAKATQGESLYRTVFGY